MPTRQLIQDREHFHCGSTCAGTEAVFILWTYPRWSPCCGRWGCAVCQCRLENTLGLSRRTLEGADFSAFGLPTLRCCKPLTGAKGTRLCRAAVLRPACGGVRQDPVPVRMNVAASERMGEMLVELWPLGSRPARTAKSACATSARITRS